MATPRNVFTIPHGVSFIDTLAQGLYDMAKGDALVLARARVLMPNRRSVRALHEAFLRLTDGKPLLLPTTFAIGDIDEDALALAPSADALSIPPAIAPMRRRLLLARLITAAYADRYNFGQALGMADELAALIDEVHTQGLDFASMEHIVSAEFAAHWQVTVDFLNLVIRENWPAILAAEGAVDPALRRRLLIESLTAELEASPPQQTLVAVAQAGDAPAILQLMNVIARSENGQVLIPGLDRNLDDQARAHIGEGHPQTLFTAMLDTLDVDAANVALWPWMPATDENAPRLVLAREVMRPGAAIGAWSSPAKPVIAPAALERLALVEAATIDEEATAIALAMRDHAEDVTREGIAALVTPDRQLAGRVAQILKRWNITVDDSAGQPLNTSFAGEWLLRIAHSLAAQHAPVPLLAMLKHPLCAGGAHWPAGMPYRSFVRHLDKFALRGPRLAGGFAAYAGKLKDDDAQKAFAHLATLLPQADGEEHDAATLIRTHITLAQDFAASPDETGEARLWRHEDGEQAARFFAELLDHADQLPPMDWATYAAIIDTLMAGIAVRPRYGTHPRLVILGQIEARLFQSARMILGGLNEDAWPPKITSDPWMSRPMRQKFGLPAPERSITLAAHDFIAGFCAPDVIMTRATYRDGAPTIPSRWLQRLNAVVQVFGLNRASLYEQGAQWQLWAQALDMPEGPASPLAPPAPSPAADLRPTALNVTDLRYFMRDPYTIFAKYVLGLRKLDALDQELQASDRGILIHAALEAFVKKYPAQLPAQPLEKLLEAGREVFAAQSKDDVTVMGLWWPRFTHIAADFIAHEAAWREGTIHAFAECKGRAEISGVTLTGKADRIEQRRDGTHAVTDYKSGMSPTKIFVRAGVEPQLPVLALMLEDGAFGALGTNTAQAGNMAYWSVGSGQFKTTDVVSPEQARAAVDETRTGLAAILSRFAQASTPYMACPDPDLAPGAGDFTHLERVAEWSVEGGDE